MMQKYWTQVEARRWDGTVACAEEIAGEFGLSACVYADPKGVKIFSIYNKEDRGEYCSAKRGDWIIKDEGLNPRKLSNREFKGNYDIYPVHPLPTASRKVDTAKEGEQ